MSSMREIAAKMKMAAPALAVSSNEQRNNAFNAQIDELRARLTELDEEEQKSLDLKESIESLRSSIANELDFTEDIGKNVVDKIKISCYIQIVLVEIAQFIKKEVIC